ncbi:uncharacterized protein LOC131215630 [Anopheles bellator]|uniref:uncharacterized protein LOC131215630 n=1 Tax=Anopheles bellator TaxID=139047 RepID=UPI002647E5A9|nr:uncharacterized protein LOC131215630 [Anopheles bellator]
MFALLVWQAVFALRAIVIDGKALEIEHPHSFSVFKRGVMLGDVSYSYSATDMGSPESGRYKTVTVIKNIAMPKPTSTMFNDRTEHFYETLEKGIAGTKKHTQVEYWPPREDNHLQQKKEQSAPKQQITSTHRPYRHRQQDFGAKTLNTPEPAAIKEVFQEEAKHPIDLLELAKSAALTLSQKANVASGENTGPVTFPLDGGKSTMKKKMNGIVSVAKEYTSVLTTDPLERQTIVSKLKTKVDPPMKVSFKEYPASSGSSEEIPLKDFEQSEYVFNHKTGSFEFRSASKAPKEVQEYLRASPYGYRERPVSVGEEKTIDFTLNTNTYNTPKELLFAELQNAVSSRNVTMIKSLAGQLEETINLGKINFESLKTEDFSRRPAEAPAETTTGRSMIDFGFANMETTTEYQEEPVTEALIMAMTTLPPTTTTTKRPVRYIAPRLRGFKRFSSKKQNN